MGYTITTNEGAVLDAHSSPLSSSQIDETLLAARDLNASAVRTSAQQLTERQQAQARSNIGAAPAGGIEILGFFESIEELNAAISGGQVRQPQPGDAYGIGIAPDYTAHMWDSVRGIWVPTRLLDRPEIGIANGAVTAEKIANGAVTAQKLADDVKTLVFTITLSAAAWSNNTQTVSNTNFYAAGYKYDISPAPSSFIAYSEALIYCENITVDGEATFVCANIPSESLTVNIARGITS